MAGSGIMGMLLRRGLRCDGQAHFRPILLGKGDGSFDKGVIGLEAGEENLWHNFMTQLYGAAMIYERHEKGFLEAFGTIHRVAKISLCPSEEIDRRAC
jgi:hypothetical protein